MVGSCRVKHVVDTMTRQILFFSRASANSGLIVSYQIWKVRKDILLHCRSGAIQGAAAGCTKPGLDPDLANKCARSLMPGAQVTPMGVRIKA